jgi:hypothetical protein
MGERGEVLMGVGRMGAGRMSALPGFAGRDIEFACRRGRSAVGGVGRVVGLVVVGGLTGAADALGRSREEPARCQRSRVGWRIADSRGFGLDSSRFGLRRANGSGRDAPPKALPVVVERVLVRFLLGVFTICWVVVSGLFVVNCVQWDGCKWSSLE